MMKKLLLVSVVSSLHLLFTLQCLSYAIEEGGNLPGSIFWRRAMYVAGFPLVYLERYWHSLFFGIDPLSILVVLNSLLWGIVLVAAYVWLKNRLNTKGS